MALKAIHETLEEIPEEFQPLYSERGGKFELTGVEGIKTTADVDRLNSALVKERNDHKLAREKLTPWGELDPTETLAQLDRIAELEHAAEGKIDDNKLDQMVESRLRTKLAPIERENSELKTKLNEYGEQIQNYSKAETRRKIHDAARKAARPSDGPKVRDSALDDVLMHAERVFEIREDDGAIVTKDGVGVTPGITPADWLAEMQVKREHWWPESQGSGAGGGAAGGAGMANNPWSKENFNLTEQGAYLRKHGVEKATAAAKRAGLKLGEKHPGM